jgi:CRISPR-associated protein Cmr3
MHKYQVKLTPTSSFFFGTEKHSGLANNGDTIANYFVESNLYPQQTTILGALRYFLLQNADEAVFKNNRIQDKTLAADLIGPASFGMTDKRQDFGNILKLGPLYLLKDNEPFHFAPLDHGNSMNANGTLVNNSKTNYTAKYHATFIAEKLVNGKGESEQLSDLIKDQVQVGNKKNSEEEGYYKQNLKHMKKEWAFAIDLETKNEIKNETKFVTLGGEKSIFRIEFKAIEEFQNLGGIPKYDRPQSYILCQSDCYIETSALQELASWGITEAVSFRNLRATVKDTNKYASLNVKDANKLKRTQRLNLLKRGSVIYFDKPENLKKAIGLIQEQENAIKIGFNHITIQNEI